MFDHTFIRENPDAFDAGLKRRGADAHADAVLALDKQARALTQQLNELQTKRNATSKQIGAAKAKGDEDAFKRLMAEVEAVKAEMPTVEAEERAKREEMKALLSGLPNLPADDVPDGGDEADNVEIRKWGEPAAIDGAKEHFEIGEALGQMDFETAAKMSGARFVLLSGGLARLERAIAAFMLDTHTQEFGYTEVSPPVLVRDEALYGTSQLPKFAEDLFQTTGDHSLIPTAEVSLTNIVREEIIDDDTLPRRYTAHTPCFRSEAGSAGRDTRGMIRLHQFTKVELVSITTPEASDAEHERMTECAETILKKLELPFRTMVLCTGDMGFSARKTYDLEVWLPGQGQYREISSCSNCGDFQARRMNARYRPDGEKTLRFPHTLNGSGLAVGRTLVAILENYQQPDGSVAVPAALQPYMGGVTTIEKA
ncbi:MAG: serine--tRNA ligase [Pseudomonadota bacterium]